MLKLKYLYENYELAKLILTNWEYDEEELDKMLSYFRISSNAIYPFYSSYQDKKVCFLRIAPEEEKIESNLYGEIEFIEYLLEHNYPALKPVPSKTGDKILKLETKCGIYYASVYEGVKGKRLDRCELNEEIMYSYGRALGKMHYLSSKFVPKVKKWNHVDVMDFIGDELLNYPDTKELLQELDEIRNGLSTLTISNENYGLVHYDFDLDNVFYEEDKKQCNVIDFDDGMYHFFILDIELSLNSLANEMDEKKFIDAKMKFLKGYEAEYPLPENYEELLPLMKRFANLYSYARILRATNEQLVNEPDWMVELRETLNDTLHEIKDGLNQNRINMK